VTRFLLASALALIGCRSQEARALEAEAARLGRAIDALRDAPNEAKTPLLRALDAEACDHTETCGLKALCSRAYTRHVEGLDKSARVKALLAPDAGAHQAREAALLLGEAESAVGEARKLTEDCAAKQGELRRRLKP
jgi:hypothetical protein